MSKYCGNCGRIVYHAEQVNANGGVYHHACFVCVNSKCHRRLDSRSCNQHDGKLYCNFCYKNLFGPSGIGFGGLCIRKQSDTNNQPRPVNAALNDHFQNQKDINSVKYYDNSNTCHHYQQQTNVSHRSNQQQTAVIYTPVFRTWYH